MLKNNSRLSTNLKRIYLCTERTCNIFFLDSIEKNPSSILNFAIKSY